MDENMVIYESLRGELLRLQAATTNETIYMYVTYFALLAFGNMYEWMLLASFGVLIVFQAMISREWWLITKCSAYVCAFFETKRKDMHWESFHRFDKYKALKATIDKEFCWKIYRWSATFLAGVSFINLVLLAFNKYQENGFSLSETIVLILGLILFHIVLYTNMKVFSKSDENVTGLKKCIEEYLCYVRNKEKFRS